MPFQVIKDKMYEGSLVYHQKLTYRISNLVKNTFSLLNAEEKCFLKKPRARTLNLNISLIAMSFPSFSAMVLEYGLWFFLAISDLKFFICLLDPRFDMKTRTGDQQKGTADSVYTRFSFVS